MDPSSNLVDLTDPRPAPTTSSAASRTPQGVSPRRRRMVLSDVDFGARQWENVAPESRNMAMSYLQSSDSFSWSGIMRGESGSRPRIEATAPGQEATPYPSGAGPAAPAAGVLCGLSNTSVPTRGAGASASPGTTPIATPQSSPRCQEGGAADVVPKRRKRNAESSSKAPPEADGEHCSICLDPWTSKGKHRICALLCGHLFGQSCIERWLKERRSCPQCGAKVGHKGTTRVIPLFLQNLVAKDTGELETARTLLEEEKRLRKQCEAERVRLSIDNESLKDKIRQLSQCGRGPLLSSLGGGPIKMNPPLRVQDLSQSIHFPSPGCSGSGASSAPYSSRFGSLSCSPRTPSERLQSVALPSAAAYSQSKPSPRRLIGNLCTGIGDGSGGGGSGGSGGGARPGSEGEGGAQRAATADKKSVVRFEFEQLLSREILSGRVVAIAGGAAGALLVSQEFGGAGGSRGLMRHGVTKFSLADLRHHKNIHLHREQVRDVKFSAHGGSIGYILSTSFDKSLKVCDLRTDSVVVEYGLEGSGWSCQWSATTPTQMFCGAIDGSRTSAVQLFDLRSTAGAVRKLHTAARQRQPVHSICHTANDLLFCATMGGVWAWGGGTKGGDVSKAADGEERTAEQLQIQAGACCSLSQGQGSPSKSSSDAAQQPFLVSTRGALASHTVFSLASASGSSPQAASAIGSRDDPGAAGHKGKAAVAGQGREASGSSEIVDFGDSFGQQFLFSDVDATVARRSAVAEQWSLAERWTRCPHPAQGHQSQHTLSRSLLWEPSPGEGLLIAGGDERTNEPWMWNASTGEMCNRLAPHRSPILDFACLRDVSPGKDLLSAVSQGEIKLYETCGVDT